MANEIKTLYSDASKQNAIFPRTKFNAVSDSEGNPIGSIASLNAISIADTTARVFDAIYPVGSFYLTELQSFDPSVTFGGSWTMVGTHLNMSNGTLPVYGNGKGLALTDGTHFGATTEIANIGMIGNQDGFGVDVGTTVTYSNGMTNNKISGVPTKAQIETLGETYKDATGLVADMASSTVTCYI